MSFWRWPLGQSIWKGPSKKFSAQPTRRKILSKVSLCRKSCNSSSFCSSLKNSVLGKKARNELFTLVRFLLFLFPISCSIWEVEIFEPVGVSIAKSDLFQYAWNRKILFSIRNNACISSCCKEGNNLYSFCNEIAAFEKISFHYRLGSQFEFSINIWD